MVTWMDFIILCTYLPGPRASHSALADICICQKVSQGYTRSLALVNHIRWLIITTVGELLSEVEVGGSLLRLRW
jgi:hypothetical protein